jgi:23S rRNA (guanosine2251-2'-O)-methyltransferase
MDLAKKASIEVVMCSRSKLDALANGNHQGIVAQIREYKTYSIDEILSSIEKGKTPLLVMCDGLEDPHNLGAILRTADAVGVDGVIIGKHRSVSLTPTVAKVSTGAIDTVKVAQ